MNPVRPNSPTATPAVVTPDLPPENRSIAIATPATAAEQHMQDTLSTLHEEGQSMRARLNARIGPPHQGATTTATLHPLTPPGFSLLFRANWPQRLPPEKIERELDHAAQTGGLPRIQALLAQAPEETHLIHRTLFRAHSAGQLAVVQALIPQAMANLDASRITMLASLLGTQHAVNMLIDWAQAHARPDAAAPLMALLARWQRPQRLAIEVSAEDIAATREALSGRDGVAVREHLLAAISSGDRTQSARVLRALPERALLARYAARCANETGQHELLAALIPAMLETRDAQSALRLINSTGSPQFARDVCDWARGSGRTDVLDHCLPAVSPFYWEKPNASDRLSWLLGTMQAERDIGQLRKYRDEAIELVKVGGAHAGIQRLITSMFHPMQPGWDLTSRQAQRMTSIKLLQACAGSLDSKVLFHLVVFTALMEDEIGLRDLASSGLSLSALSESGCTPLQSVVAIADEIAVNILLIAGADINARSRLGYTALHIAARTGNLQLVELLLQNGAKRDVRSDASAGAVKPEQLAAAYGHRDCQRALAPWYRLGSANSRDIDTTAMDRQLVALLGDPVSSRMS